MAYIGNQPNIGNWRKLDNISGSFNGSTTSFTTSVAGENITAASANQLFISLNDVIQEPGVDFTVTTNSINFTVAPSGGATFFGIYAGDSLNVAGVSDGTIGTAQLADSSVTSAKIAPGIVGFLDVTQTWTKGQRGEVTVLTSGTTITPDFSDSNNFSLDLAHNATLANPTNLVAGQSGSIWITQTTGSNTLAYGSYWDFTGGTAPILSVAASATDCLVYAVQSSTRITATLITNLS